MKTFLLLWAMPIAFLGAWYSLSYYDMSFGIFMLTREAHDLVFRIYGNVLGIPPETIPPLVMRAVVVDSLVLFAIMAFRRRKTIKAWWAARQVSSPDVVETRASPESLSSAP
ncbi:DUF6105 family protein [Rhizobium glycinendophyticum]|uniref:Transmembrane protein n=1 Tax=Rhizobium glycinendophyticum TaxID=2589807 RepID=A0A504U8B1_9HYPH|nr:DUF6105 family protein [Rhizobium glycinendophyticum]TPP10749.1 hypothetical protein FJQ55_07885 [Rhizobium glycinendophyticum]